MSTEGSECSGGTCVSGALCSLRELAVGSEWERAAERLSQGHRCCSVCVEFVLHKAVQEQQWDVVMLLVEMGVSTTLRNKVWQSALLHRHVPCAAKLMELGVSHQYREDGIQNKIASGQCEFVLQVVKMVKDPELTEVVLQESLKQKQWPLVGELVKEGLSVAQMEATCAQAVADRQWTVALQLLHGGVSASQWMVDEFFENRMAPALLDLLPAGCGGDGLRGLLLMGSIRHGQGDFTLRLLQQLSVSDTQLMEAMKYAVHLLDKTILLQIIRASSRSRRVFKQKFIHQHWKENLQPMESESDGGYGSEIHWIFETFYANGEKDLALYVATSNASEACLIGDFCENEKHNFNLKQRKCRYALTKLHEVDDVKYVRFVEDLYKMDKTPQSDRSFLFRQAIRFEQFNLSTSLCEHGVSRKDLKFAVERLFETTQYEYGAGSYAFFKIHRRIGEEDRVWLNQYTIKFAMRQYFKHRSDACFKRFIDLFVGCHNKDFTRQIFKEAVRKCVKFDCVDRFVELCRKQLTMHAISEQSAVREDCIFAYTCAVTGNRPHFVEKICEEKMTKQFPSCQNKLGLIIDIIVEKEAWNMLPYVSAGFKGLSWNESPLDVLEYCLQKMLTDQATWPGMAPALNQWIAEEKLEPDVRRRVRTLYKAMMRERQPESLPSLKEWCVDTGHANLAFFLALVSWDWELVKTLVNTQTTLGPHQCMLIGAVGLAAEVFASYAGAAILKMCPVSAENVARLDVDLGTGLLVKACEMEGLLDWALILNRCDWTYVKAHHGQCQNLVVLNSILETATKSGQWDLTRQLLTRCTDTETLKHVLMKAVEHGQVDIAETLINRVDSSTIGHIDFAVPRTLLFRAVAARYHISTETRLSMVGLCIASGLSTFQRETPFLEPRYNGGHNCPLLWVLTNTGSSHLKIIQLLLASGACSYERLHKLRRLPDIERQSFRRGDPGKEEWRTGFRYVSEAAATPFSLVHLARLVVSHCIGCQPGRSERIQGLPVPETVRELLRFKDALAVIL